MKQTNKQSKRKTRCIACDDDVWNGSADIARNLKVSTSAYVRGLLETEIERRNLRIGHAKEVVSLRIPQSEGAGRH